MWPFSEIRRARNNAALWKKQCEEWRQIATDLSKYAPKPTCKHCGSNNLAADQAGYVYDAVTWWGAPLMCLDCGTERATRAWRDDSVCSVNPEKDNG